MLRFGIDALISYGDTQPSVQTLFESGHSRVLLICARAGQRLAEHRSPCQVALHVIRGTTLFFEGARSLEISAGDLVALPPHAPHRFEAVSDSVILAILAPHPARDRYPEDQVNRIVPKAPHQIL